MAIETVLLANIILTIFAIVLSTIAIVWYYRGYVKFLGGDFKSYATWMFLGIILYTLHLFSHLAYLSAEAGWLNVSEDITELALYIFLAIAGVVFLVGAYLYLQLANSVGFKK